MVDLSGAIANTPKKIHKSYNITAVNYSILGLIVFFGLAYLFSINSLGTQGYAIRQLEVQVRQLESRHKYLELEASNLQSITNIQQLAAESDYVPAGNATYMKDADFALK